MKRLMGITIRFGNYKGGNLGEGKGVMSEAEQKELINQLFMNKGTYSGSKLIAGGGQTNK